MLSSSHDVLIKLSTLEQECVVEPGLSTPASTSSGISPLPLLSFPNKKILFYILEKIIDLTLTVLLFNNALIFLHWIT